MKKVVQCATPGCGDLVTINDRVVKTEYNFCPKCREVHSYYVLSIQVQHEKLIQEIILDSKMFGSAAYMADYIGVSFVTLYNWIYKYFGISFQEFRRKYICKSEKCYSLDIYMSSYSRTDYILKKIRSRKHCACINTLDKDNIMTDAPLSLISQIIAGCPRIGKISDRKFALLPTPIFLIFIPLYDIRLPLYSVQPIYF